MPEYISTDLQHGLPGADEGPLPASRDDSDASPVPRSGHSTPGPDTDLPMPRDACGALYNGKILNKKRSSSHLSPVDNQPKKSPDSHRKRAVAVAKNGKDFAIAGCSSRAHGIDASPSPSVSTPAILPFSQVMVSEESGREMSSPNSASDVPEENDACASPVQLNSENNGSESEIEALRLRHQSVREPGVGERGSSHPAHRGAPAWQRPPPAHLPQPHPLYGLHAGPLAMHDPHINSSGGVQHAHTHAHTRLAGYSEVLAPGMLGRSHTHCQHGHRRGNHSHGHYHGNQGNHHSGSQHRHQNINTGVGNPQEATARPRCPVHAHNHHSHGSLHHHHHHHHGGGQPQAAEASDIRHSEPASSEPRESQVPAAVTEGPHYHQHNSSGSGQRASSGVEATHAVADDSDIEVVNVVLSRDRYVY